MAYLKTHTPGFMKDPRTGMVVNTDLRGQQRYKAELARVKRIKELEEKARKADAMEERLQALEKAILNGKI